MPRPKTKPSNVVVTGPLREFVDDYGRRLTALGYSPLSVVNEKRQVAHLSRWMTQQGLAVRDVNDDVLSRFLDDRRAERGAKACSMQGLVPLLDSLQAAHVDRGVTASPIKTPDELLLAAFAEHLTAERGLASCTIEAYVARAGRFLEGMGGVSGLVAADVVAAVQAEAARVSVGSTQYFVAALRAFLRFCFIDGRVDSDLSAAALAIAGRRRSSLPRGISVRDAEALLASCDRRRSEGRRDYAVLVLLVRLGLRASEVAGLRLDDLDWRAGQVTVRGKGSRVDRLPLPVEVGEALVGYLRRGRPAGIDCRRVFLRSIAPLGPIGRGGIGCIVRRACARAGLPEIGPHRLRHSLACHMVNVGLGLPEIGQVLRHAGVSTTAVYARVDVTALAAIARPWPGAEAIR